MDDNNGGLLLPKKIGWAALFSVALLIAHAAVLEYRVDAMEAESKENHGKVDKIYRTVCNFCVTSLGIKNCPSCQ